MDWRKIAVANSLNPGLGLIEYEKQQRKAQKFNEIEYNLRNMRVGATLDVEKYTIKKMDHINLILWFIIVLSVNLFQV